MSLRYFPCRDHGERDVVITTGRHFFFGPHARGYVNGIAAKRNRHTGLLIAERLQAHQP
jgi:hypothetical protein